VVELVDEHRLTISDAAKRIGMSSYEAKRRYRAFKALSQMQKDEEYQSYAEPRMYPLFHEAVAQPKVRSWLGWGEDTFEFANDEMRARFYELLIPHKSEEDEEVARPLDPKLRTYADVRSLAEILGNAAAEESLADPSQPFSEALAIAKASSSTNWLPRIRAALQALDTITVPTLKSLDQDGVRPLVQLHSALQERLDDWRKLTGIEPEP